MKVLILVLLALVVSNSYASQKVMKCSNSDGSVSWESGPEIDEINLKYSNFVEGTLHLPLEQVSIKFKSKIPLREKTIRHLNKSSTKKIFAGRIRILASMKHPDVLRGQFPQNKVETEVICTKILTKVFGIKKELSVIIKK
jgi:hypothetical protein